VASKKEFWIQEAIKNKGSLRKSLKAKKGKNIPVSKLKTAAKKKGKIGKRARLALTLRKLSKGKKKNK
jgi:hypothetical protein